jgi:hypothetical protein
MPDVRVLIPRAGAVGRSVAAKPLLVGRREHP